MPSIRSEVVLKRKEEAWLRDLVRRGRHPARVLTRARVLLLTHEGKSNRDIREHLGCSRDMVRLVRLRYRTRGTVEEAVQDAPRPGSPPKITPAHEAFVTATACTEPPEGHAHWTLHALKDKLLETHADLKGVSHEKIRQILLRHELKPWREKNVVRPETHAPVS